MQTIILAAGTGTRLGGLEHSVPKPLVTIGGLPLIAHALAHACASGCQEAVVVIGHQGSRVREAAVAAGLGLTLRFVETPDPSTPNGDSLLVTERHAASRFFLQMVDHVFAEPVLNRLAAGLLGDGRGRVLVDREPVGLDVGDATKVQLAGDAVIAIGKTVDPWDAIDAGCFLLSHGIFDALRTVPRTEARTVSSAMRRLAATQALDGVDIGGVRWVDVDTPSDRAAAERLLAGATA